ncbi:MAG: hypothetical protein QOE70_1637 [Chthoniobacter sp.]|jgi:hypothetical protein|nr:hypothetical protein [Chthoniobacter sp.]
MKYAVSLSGLGIALAGIGAYSGMVGVVLIWLGGDFLILGIAHFRRAQGLFGKRPDGTLPFWSWIAFLPLLLFSSLVWHAARIFSSEPAFNHISDDLVVGRRLLAHERAADFVNYVDLTAEFQEPKIFRESPSYLAFPVLDASAPSPEILRAVVSQLRPGATFIHCAQGHGRTGLFALAVLLTSGAVRSVDEGLSLLTSIRPAIHLSPQQADCIRAYATNFA